ncbi:MAG: DUF2190 family protein [Ignavibacterium sp.]|nr:DUF2190 family protein [Ignavibacterium sp.]
MKTEQPLLITSVQCTNSSGIFKHRFVHFDGNYGREAYKSLGVCYADTSFNEMMPVMAKGIALVVTGDAVNVGDPIESFDDGVAIPQTTGFLEGYAMDSAVGSDILIRVLLA